MPQNNTIVSYGPERSIAMAPTNVLQYMQGQHKCKDDGTDTKEASTYYDGSGTFEVECSYDQNKSTRDICCNNLAGHRSKSISIPLKRSQVLQEHDLNVQKNNTIHSDGSTREMLTVKPFKRSDGNARSVYSHRHFGIDKSMRMKHKRLSFHSDKNGLSRAKATHARKKWQSTKAPLQPILFFRETASLMIISHLLQSLTPLLGSTANTHKEVEETVAPKKVPACNPTKVQAWRNTLRHYASRRRNLSSNEDALTRSNSKINQSPVNEQKTKRFSSLTRPFSRVKQQAPHTY